MRRVLLLSLSSFFLFASLAGCDSGPPTIASGVEGTKVLAEMSDEEATSLCNATKELSASMAERAADADPCIMSGLAVGALGAMGGDASAAKETCEGMVDLCELAGSSGETMEMEEETDEITCDGTWRESMGAECTATVAEYEACGNAMSELADDFYSNLSCSSDLTALQATNSACQVLEDKGCMSAFSAGSSEAASSMGMGSEMATD